MKNAYPVFFPSRTLVIGKVEFFEPLICRTFSKVSLEKYQGTTLYYRIGILSVRKMGRSTVQQSFLKSITVPLL